MRYLLRRGVRGAVESLVLSIHIHIRVQIEVIHVVLLINVRNNPLVGIPLEDLFLLLLLEGRVETPSVVTRLLVVVWVWVIALPVNRERHPLLQSLLLQHIIGLKRHQSIVHQLEIIHHLIILEVPVLDIEAHHLDSVIDLVELVFCALQNRRFLQHVHHLEYVQLLLTHWLLVLVKSIRVLSRG